MKVAGSHNIAGGGGGGWGWGGWVGYESGRTDICWISEGDSVYRRVDKPERQVKLCHTCR